MVYISVTTIYSCTKKGYIPNNKDAVIVQEKVKKEYYYHIFYRKISNWEYGKINVCKWDFEHISPGDTLYLK